MNKNMQLSNTVNQSISNLNVDCQNPTGTGLSSVDQYNAGFEAYSRGCPLFGTEDNDFQAGWQDASITDLNP